MSRPGNQWFSGRAGKLRTSARVRPDERELEPTNTGRYFDVERDCWGRFVDGQFVPELTT